MPLHQVAEAFVARVYEIRVAAMPAVGEILQCPARSSAGRIHGRGRLDLRSRDAFRRAIRGSDARRRVVVRLDGLPLISDS